MVRCVGCSLCPTPTFLPQHCVYHEVKLQQGCHLPQGGIADNVYLPFLEQKPFLAVVGALDANWQTNETAGASQMYETVSNESICFHKYQNKLIFSR